MPQGSVKLLLEDVKELRPSVFIAVPRVLERISDGVKAKLAKVGCWAAALFPSFLFLGRQALLCTDSCSTLYCVLQVKVGCWAVGLLQPGAW